MRLVISMGRFVELPLDLRQRFCCALVRFSGVERNRCDQRQSRIVGIDTGEPTDGFYDHVRELPDVRADLGNAHLQAAAVAAELVITLDTVKKHVGHVLDKPGPDNSA